MTDSYENAILWALSILAYESKIKFEFIVVNSYTMSINTNTTMAAAPTQEESLRNPFAIKMNIFNDQLLAEPEKVPFMKYFIKARRECFRKIMFNFMGYFLALTTKEELFCFHDKLREYGVIKTNRI